MYRTIRRIGIVVALAVGLVGAGGPTAQAAVNPYTAQSLCGLGYTEVDQDPIRKQATGALLGTVHLLYNPFTGYGCTATVKYGVRRHAHPHPGLPRP